MTIKCQARANAKKAGDIRYLGNPCIHGHSGVRHTSTGGCVECVNINSQIFSKSAKGVAYRKKWRSQDHVKEKERAYNFKYLKKYHYGMSWEEYLEKVRAAGNACEICKQEFLPIDYKSGKRGNAACIDHDHNTGKIRGVICNRCNRALGLLKDSRSILIAAAEYLAK